MFVLLCKALFIGNLINIITPFPLRGKQRYIIEWYSMYPLYARRFMLNVIGGAQPIDVLRALTHIVLNVWVSSRCFPSPYEQSAFIVHKFFEKLIGTRPLRGCEPATFRNPRQPFATPSHRRSTTTYYTY